MIAVLLNIMLAFLWGAVSGSFAFLNLAFGYAVGFLVLLAFRDETRAGPYIDHAQQAARLVGLFLRELLSSNLRVAYDVVTPRHRMQPAVLALDVDVRDDVELILLSSMITRTPGNLVIDVSQDRCTLFLHAMYAGDREEVRRSVKESFEREVLRLTR